MLGQMHISDAHHHLDELANHRVDGPSANWAWLPEPLQLACALEANAHVPRVAVDQRRSALSVHANNTDAADPSRAKRWICPTTILGGSYREVSLADWKERQDDIRLYSMVAAVYYCRCCIVR